MDSSSSSHTNSRQSSGRGSSSSTVNSTSVQHYTALLQTVSELRLDLEKTMNKIRFLEDQNSSISNNYNTIKEELLDTRRKYSEARENYMATVVEKLEAEKAQEGFMDRLKSQLLEKTLEFEKLREQYVPHDIDAIRIKVQEELTIQHKQQVQAVEHQLELQRNQFYEIRKAAQKTKAEYDLIVMQQQQDNEALKGEREAVEGGLRAHLVKLQTEKLYSGEEKARSVAIQLVEVKHLLELTREEARLSTSEKDRVQEELQALRLVHQEEVLHLRSLLGQAQAERAGTEERCTRAASDSDGKDLLLRTLRQAVEDLSQKVESSSKQLAAAERDTLSTKETFANQLEETRYTLGLERKELEETVTLMLDKVNESDERVRKAQRETAEMQIRAEFQQGEIRRTFQSQTQELRRKFGAVELDLSNTRNSLKMVQSNTASQLHQSKMEIESHVSDLSRVKREKDVLHAKLRDLDSSSENMRRQLHSAKEEAGGRVEAAEKAMRVARNQMSTLESQLRASRDRETQALNALMDAKEATTQVQKKYDDAKKAIDLLQIEFTKKSQVQMERLSEDMKKRKEKAVAKEKRRADVYKEKALSEHSKNKSLEREREMQFRVQGAI